MDGWIELNDFFEYNCENMVRQKKKKRQDVTNHEKGKERERERERESNTTTQLRMYLYVYIQWCHLVQLDPAGWCVMCRSVSMYIKYSYLVSVDRIIIIHAVEALVVDYLFVCLWFVLI